ncbi:hypothetical protein [Legionella sp.]|uniref:hypothetical protein n=1 Tax=Legionella sp. TaxID=459 RepID=UPI003C98E065
MWAKAPIDHQNLSVLTAYVLSKVGQINNKERKGRASFTIANKLMYEQIGFAPQGGFHENGWSGTVDFLKIKEKGRSGPHR